MKIMPSINRNNGYRAMQYLVTMLIVLLTGYLTSLLPVMTRLEFADRLTAADIVLFITQAAALSFFYLSAIHAVTALPKTGDALFFFKAVALPITWLMIVVIGQNIVWQVIAPFIGSSEKTLYYAIVILLILLNSIWLVWVAFQNAPYLIDSLHHIKSPIATMPNLLTSACSECGQLSARSAKFCRYCGHPKQKTTRCAGCHELLTPDQKFCHHCGLSVADNEVHNP